MKPDEIIDRFARLARKASDEDLDLHAQDGLHRLERALAAPAQRRGPSVTVRLVILFAAASVAVGVALFPRERPLTFEVTPGCASEHGYVVSKGADAAMRFSDRSELVLDLGARLRVSSLEVRGAHLMLEGGAVHASIRPRPEARWAIDAGPYVVRVTGTEFDVAWMVDTQTLDLLLRKGSVTVEGPFVEGDFHMIAGQHLVANAEDGSLAVTDEQSERSSAHHAVVAPATGPADAPDAAAATDSERTPALSGARPAAAGPPPRTAAAPLWAERVTHGDYRAVLDDAEREGIERVLARASQTDLGALADAARYARSYEVARRALVTLRARFPGSVRARDAAFFLGDLAESGREEQSALDWYDTYLRESPDAAYASQALGRKMLLTLKLRGPAAASASATEYLERFRDGPYAPNARKLLQTP